MTTIPFEMVATDKLTTHPDNPRRGDVEAVMSSIQANGFYGALVVQRSTSHVLAGNHRLRAARQLGMTEVPVVWVDCDDDRARRILVVDNRSSDLARWDDEALAALLADMGDLSGTLFKDDDLAKLVASMQGPSEFLDIDPEALEISYCCPACGYEWSGNPKPGSV
jgi:ParB-like chromosome segregation protein Spo0J